MSWLRRSLLAYARVQHAAMRALESSHAFVEGVLVRALDADEKARLTVDIFDARAQREPGVRALCAWEQRWLSERLPKPPARVLVAAAGSGAEARFLCDAGYEVAASEPAGACQPQLMAAVRGRGSVRQASFRDLIDGGALDACDAVLVGWSALSHVLDRASQLALLRALDACCPRGPILLSCYWIDELDAPRESRAWRLGARIGAVAARARGTAGGDDGVERFFGHAGFVHSFTTGELQWLAHAVGRRLELELSDYPHASLLPL